MPRSKRGWLKPDALKTAGVTEQFAMLYGDTMHSVELWWDHERLSYVVTYKRTPPAGIIEGREWRTGEDLRAARARFEEVERIIRELA